MCRVFWLYLFPFLSFFLNLWANLLFTSLPNMLCGKLTKKKIYFPCGIWTCTHCEVYRNPKHFHREPYGQTRQVLLKVLNYQCDSCFYFLERFTPWLHITYELLEKGPWSHLGSVCFSEDVLMQLSQPFHLQLAPLSTDDQSSKTPERF